MHQRVAALIIDNYFRSIKTVHSEIICQHYEYTEYVYIYSLVKDLAGMVNFSLHATMYILLVTTSHSNNHITADFCQLS